LVLAKEKLGLNLVALTVDNGFITDNVLKFTEKTCKKLKIPWTCIKKPLLKEFQEEFQPDEDGIWQAKTGLDFNTFATQEMHKAIREWSIENGSHRVIMGSRIHTHMEPRVSCLDMQTIEQGELNFSLCYIHLLFGLSVNNIRRKRILSDLGWKEPKIKGFSHSSVLPGFADPAWRRKMGYGTDTGYLETELRCGAHTLQEAKEMIRNAKGMDLSPQITRFFQDK